MQDKKVLLRAHAARKDSIEEKVTGRPQSILLGTLRDNAAFFHGSGRFRHPPTHELLRYFLHGPSL